MKYAPRLTATGLQEFSDFFGINFAEKIKPPKRTTSKKLFIADTHFPYHHKRLFEKTINDNLDADELFILGDEFDMMSWSHYRKTATLNPALEFREAFRTLKETCEVFPKVNILLTNHDKRFIKWMYDNVPNQALQFTHYYIVEELLSTIPNLTILCQETEDEDRKINYIHQHKNCVFTHVEKSNIDITKTAQEIDKTIKHKWEHFLGIKDYDILMQAHNHSAGMVWVNNRLIMQIPCLIDISKPSFDYIFDGKMAGNPPAIGYVTGYEVKGKIDPNSIHITKLA